MNRTIEQRGHGSLTILAVKVQCHQAVKLIPSSYQSIANPASSRRPFASFQYPWERTWTRSYHEGDLVVSMLALSGLPFADNRRHGRYAIECMVQRNTANVQRPFVYVVLGDGDQWVIEAEWPDGSIEPIRTFRAHAEAVDWVKTHSATWMRE
jgi:hypothetical protein